MAKTLDKLNVDQLKELATKNAVTLTDDMKKADIVAALEKAGVALEEDNASDEDAKFVFENSNVKTLTFVGPNGSMHSFVQGNPEDKVGVFMTNDEAVAACVRKTEDWQLGYITEKK